MKISKAQKDVIVIMRQHNGMLVSTGNSYRILSRRGGHFLTKVVRNPTFEKLKKLYLVEVGVQPAGYTLTDKGHIFSQTA